VGQILFTNNGALRMTTTKQYDLLNRLTNISSSSNFTYSTEKEKKSRFICIQSILTCLTITLSVIQSI